jgi:hypothetical protein
MTEVRIFVVALTRDAKRSAGIKLLVENKYGDKTLSIIQTNFIIKAVKDKK